MSATGAGFIANNGLFELQMSPEMQMSLMKNGVIGGVSASMPIFTGGQIVNGNKLAEVGEEVSRLQYNLSENEVRLTTENYFGKSSHSRRNFRRWLLSKPNWTD